MPNYTVTDIDGFIVHHFWAVDIRDAIRDVKFWAVDKFQVAPLYAPDFGVRVPRTAPWEERESSREVSFKTRDGHEWKFVVRSVGLAEWEERYKRMYDHDGAPEQISYENSL